MLIIPAIDLIGGKCVRLVQGDFKRETVYSDQPVSVARDFFSQGATWLHCVDLDGAKSGNPQNLELLRAISRECPDLNIEFGGGIRDSATIRSVLASGAKRVVLGSVLTKSPEFARECFAEFGEQVVAGVDTSKGKVAVHGWVETSELDGISFAKELSGLGCRRFIWTDIATDGMLEGPNLSGLSEWVARVPAPIIASGGVSTIEDLKHISDCGAEAAIVGKALFEGRFGLAEAIQDLA